jgi:circadian clock protein KaiC
LCLWPFRKSYAILKDPLMKKVPMLSSTGISGLDEIVKGGLPSNRLYLLRGEPGVGKTTLAMQFLLEGLKKGEPGLYVTLSETRTEIEDIASSHGWDLTGLSIFELSALEQELAENAENTLFHPSEIELNRTTELLLRKIDEIQPVRLVLDSLSELRLLSDSALRYRRQMLALKQYFAGRQITVMFLDDHTEGGDLHVQSIAHGVISLESVASDYGAERRRVKVSKLRGVGFRGGYHDAVIVGGGLKVFPRLIAAEHVAGFKAGQLKTGLEHLDRLLGGGIHRGTSCLVLGPPGSGKSSLVSHFAVHSAAQGEKVFACLFEETIRNALTRARNIGQPLQKYVREGMIELRQLDPGELAPGQFVDLITNAVERDGVKVVVIDSLNGYLQAMPDVKFLSIQLHELLTFLSHRGVVTLMTVAQQGILGPAMISPVEITYLADTVFLLRYFEYRGEICKAISVLKKRIGEHEATLRQIQIDRKGIRVGQVLHNFEGVLTGVPRFVGAEGDILSKR